ncbi:MAG: hypothetical protein BWK77_05900, partial [Verrucomicrobia bacterium A1]
MKFVRGSDFTLWLAVGLCWGPALAQSASAADMTNVNTLVASIVLPNLDGKYIYLSNICYPGEEKLRKPRSVVVLNFMATWCGPCKKELPELLAVCREYRDQGVSLFVVSTDSLSKRADLEKLIADFGVDSEVLLDPYRVALG